MLGPMYIKKKIKKINWVITLDVFDMEAVTVAMLSTA